MTKATRTLRAAWSSIAARLAVPALAAAIVAACSSSPTTGTTSTIGTGGAVGPSTTTTGSAGATGTGGATTGAGGMTGSGGGTTGSGTGNVEPGCASNADCTNSPKGKICDTSTGLCVACLAADDQCPQGQYCDPTVNQCKVGCTDASDCMGMGSALLCDVSLHTCVGCVADGDCPLGSVCFPQNHVCVPGCSPTHDCQQNFSCCGSTCYDLKVASAHCGSCETNCNIGANPPATCGNGVCDPGVPGDPTKPAETCATCPGDCSCHAAAVCKAGVCGLAPCDAAYANCNGDLTDGCEWNVLQDGPCACAPGSTQSCYFGGPGTVGKGACVAGVQTCDPSGSGFGACVGQVLPKPEVCGNNVDDDCNGAVDDAIDADGDGWTACNGDCCDTPGPGCANPKQVNPGAFEVPGNGVDDDCDPATSDVAVASCSPIETFASVTALQMAQAIDICQQTVANPPKALKKWGLISAQQLLANGIVPSGQALTDIQNAQTAVLVNYGTTVAPKKGPTMLGISSGTMRDQLDPGFVNPNGGSAWTTSVQPPANYLAAHAGALPSSSGCSGMCPAGAGANDSVNLRMSIRVPTNALSFSYDFRFFSAEYWNFQCTQYNDFYLALLQSGAPGLPADKNISFDALNNPISVNNGFFSVCIAKGCNQCVGGAGDLAGTGMQLNNTGGATSWLTTDAPVLPGETIQLELMLFDVSDHALDSVVLVDNFRWNLQPSVVGTHQ